MHLYYSYQIKSILKLHQRVGDTIVVVNSDVHAYMKPASQTSQEKLHVLYY